MTTQRATRASDNDCSATTTFAQRGDERRTHPHPRPRMKLAALYRSTHAAGASANELLPSASLFSAHSVLAVSEEPKLAVNYPLPAGPQDPGHSWAITARFCAPVPLAAYGCGRWRPCAGTDEGRLPPASSSISVAKLANTRVTRVLALRSGVALPTRGVRRCAGQHAEVAAHTQGGIG